MDIYDKKPEDVLKKEFFEQYKELYEDIWQRLTHVGTTIIILERIESFPFWDRFYSPQDNIFWTMVYTNFMYVAIILLHGLTKDNVSDTHTLVNFKNKILANLNEESMKAEYQKKLKTAKLDTSLNDIHDKITEMRHKIIAHRLFDKNDKNKLQSVKRVTLPEIRQVYNDIEKLFRVCSFGSRYLTTYYIEGTCGGKPIEKDIDHLLDLIVKDSYWLNEPERRPLDWEALKKTKSSEEILELNQWRKKFGMPEV